MMVDAHGDEEIPNVFIAGAEGIPGWTPRLRHLQVRCATGLGRQPSLWGRVASPAQRWSASLGECRAPSILLAAGSAAWLAFRGARGRRCSRAGGQRMHRTKAALHPAPAVLACFMLAS